MSPSTAIRLQDGVRWVTRPRMPARLGKIARLIIVFAVVWSMALGGGARPGLAEDRFEVAGFWFAVPPAWVRQPAASTMRKAQFRVPNPAPGYDGIAVFYQFPRGLGGTAERNIARWYSQFKEPNETLGAKVETRQRAGRQLHYFRATGTLIGRDGEMPGYALHVALLDGPAGRAFVRFVAPKAVARANEAAFRKLIDAAFEGTR